ncbi:MAG: phosphotransferase [Candidatus Yanofskybacteria bacterium]|nr:phosphotransferase [Candidatus Yanofskybacteria bacterium]
MEAGIFGPNNHSAFQIKWKPVWGDIRKSIGQNLLQYFDLTNIQDVSQVDEWEHNSNNFRVVCWTGVETKSFLLRKNIKIKDEQTLQSIDLVSVFLKQAGVSVPQSVHTRQGNLYYFDGKHYWTLSEFVVGNHFCGTEKELREVARGIGRLDRSLANLTLDLPGLEVTTWSQQEFESFFIFASKKSDETNQFLLSKQNVLRQIMAKNIQGRARWIKAKVQIIHNDLHPHNTIFKDQRLRAIIDFGNMQQAPLLFDIAQALHRFVRQYVVCRGRPWAETLGIGVSIFLSEYLKENALPNDEIIAISHFMREGLLRKIATDVRKRHDRSVIPPDLTELKKLISLLEETEPLEQCISDFYGQQKK